MYLGKKKKKKKEGKKYQKTETPQLKSSWGHFMYMAQWYAKEEFFPGRNKWYAKKW